MAAAQSMNRLITILQLPRDIHNAREPFHCQGITSNGGSCRLPIGEPTRLHVSSILLPDLAMRLRREQFALPENDLDDLAACLLCARYHRNNVHQRDRLRENWTTLLREHFDAIEVGVANDDPENEDEIDVAGPDNIPDHEAIDEGPAYDDHGNRNENRGSAEIDQDVGRRAPSGHDLASPRQIIDMYILPRSEASAQSFHTEIMDELANRQRNDANTTSPRHSIAGRSEQERHDIEAVREWLRRADMRRGLNPTSSHERRTSIPRSHRSSVDREADNVHQAHQQSPVSRSARSAVSRRSSHSRQDPINERPQPTSTSRPERPYARVDEESQSSSPSPVAQPSRHESFPPVRDTGRRNVETVQTPDDAEPESAAQQPDRPAHCSNCIEVGHYDDFARQNAYMNQYEEDDEPEDAHYDPYTRNEPAQHEGRRHRQRELAADQVYTESMTGVVGAFEMLLRARDARDAIRLNLLDHRPTYSQPYGNGNIHYDDFDQMAPWPQRPQHVRHPGNEGSPRPLPPYQHYHERVNRERSPHVSTASAAPSRSRDDYRADPYIQSGRIQPRRRPTMREI